MAKLSVLLVVLLFGVCCGYRILVFYPGVSGSLLISFNPLFRELSKRGHELTIVTKRPLPGNSEYNITEKVITPEKMPDVFELFKKMPFAQKIVYGWFHAISECEKLYDNPEIIDIIKSETKYDLFIGSPYYYFECSIALAHHLRLPILNIYSNRFSVHASHPGGHPNPLAYISELHLSFGNDMGLWERTINTLFNIVYSVGLNVYYLPAMAKVVEHHFPHVPPLQEMLSRVPVTLMNTNLAIHQAQPMLPGVIPVGGLTISEHNPLPQNLQQWMDTSEQGVILFSLGSNIKVSSLNPEVLQVILATFARLPQRVIMKWEGDELKGKPPNVHIQKWVPQAAVLGHRHCRMFMTHGGLHSWEEGVHFSIPLLGILPVFFDQTHNLAEMQNRGHGLYFSGPWTEDNLYSAIQDVINNPKYKENLQKASRIWLDQPTSPLDRAVYWTEYVIRHQGASHLQSTYSTAPWYQLSCLDVLSVIILTLILVSWVVLAILRFLRRQLIDYEYIIFNYVLRVCSKIKLR